MKLVPQESLWAPQLLISVQLNTTHTVHAAIIIQQSVPTSPGHPRIWSFVLRFLPTSYPACRVGVHHFFCTKCELFAPGSHHCAQAQETCSITQQRGIAHILGFAEFWSPLFLEATLCCKAALALAVLYLIPSHGHHGHVQNHFVHNTFALHICFGQKYFGCLVSYPTSGSPPAASWEKAMLCSAYITLTMSIVYKTQTRHIFTTLYSVTIASLMIDTEYRKLSGCVGGVWGWYNLGQKIDWNCGDGETKAAR